MSNELTSIIIVTCGARGFLKACLDSVRRQTYSATEAIVIDNSLKPDILQDIMGYYPEAKIFSAGENLFYSAGLNKGIALSKGDFILCLNDDVILGEKFIEEALRGFSVSDNIGMVSAKILRSNRETIDSTGLFLSCWRTARERGYALKDRGQYEKEGYIFGVNGAVAFYRKEMLEKIKINNKYFDSDLRMFYGDLDIAWRAQNAGWKGYYIPAAIAYHVRGATARGDKGVNKRFARRYLSDDLLLDLIINRYRTIRKNDTFLGFLLHLPFIIIYDILAWGYVILFRPSILKKFFSG